MTLLVWINVRVHCVGGVSRLHRPQLVGTHLVVLHLDGGALRIVTDDEVWIETSFQCRELEVCLTSYSTTQKPRCASREQLE